MPNVKSYIDVLLLVTALYELVETLPLCTYVVESRASSHVTIPESKCEIMDALKDRWLVFDNDEESRMRIRSSSVIVKYRKKRVQYFCIESRGHTFLLGTTGYLNEDKAVLCVGFTQLPNTFPAEYTIRRLNRHGPEGYVLSPEIIETNDATFPSLNDTCAPVAIEDDKMMASMRRMERRCSFPEDLQHSWNSTESARDVTFHQKMLVLNYTGRATGHHVGKPEHVYRFDCSLNDGDIFVLRLTEYKPEQDGLLCLNITRLTDDLHYKYEMTRLNSGTEVDRQVKLVPTGKYFDVEDDCDWLESPGKPEYLY